MKKIILYTSPTCAFCPAVKKLLNKSNVTYEEIDITQNQQAIEEMKQVSGQMSVPVTVIDGTVIVGYNKKKLNQALEQ